jgi:general stress protein 26
MNIEEKISEEIVSMNQPLGVMSTVSADGKPEAASMYYISDNALNIYFITRSASRKFQNLKNNPQAAFVITSEHPPKTIQLEGTVSEMMNPEEQVTYYEKLMAKATESMKMLPVEQIPAGELVFMKMSTTWARFGSFEVMKEGDKFVEVKLG